MIDFLGAVRAESDRFAIAIKRGDLHAQVPSCPDWDLADLIWHLTEVQEFWASIVDGLLDSPEQAQQAERPGDDELIESFAAASARLSDALAERDPDEACWSWHEPGQHVGWVRRRQAHEALIHRIDAELTVGSITPVDPALATDGIDEILTTMLDASDIPGWSSFEPDGRELTITVPGRSWSMDLGRFHGTSPATGKVYDEPALRLRGGVGDQATVVQGDAATIDLWLWGRSALPPGCITGDAATVAFVREAAAAATQ